MDLSNQMSEVRRAVEDLKICRENQLCLKNRVDWLEDKINQMFLKNRVDRLENMSKWKSESKIGCKANADCGRSITHKERQPFREFEHEEITETLLGLPSFATSPDEVTTDQLNKIPHLVDQKTRNFRENAESVQTRHPKPNIFQNDFGTTADTHKMENEEKQLPSNLTAAKTDKRQTFQNTETPYTEKSHSSSSLVKQTVTTPQTERSHFPHGHSGLEALFHEIHAKEQNICRESDRRGMYNVICLDISESMSEGDAWSKAKDFVTDFLAGLEEAEAYLSTLHEYVALVTFGHETKLQVGFTSDYTKIRDTIGSLALGGPSPLYAGIGIGCAVASAPACLTAFNMRMSAKLIVISDGMPTETTLQSGPDVLNPSLDVDTKRTIISTIPRFIRAAVNLFLIPVGNYCQEFLELLAGVADGQMRLFTEGKCIAMRNLLLNKAVYVIKTARESLRESKDEADFSLDSASVDTLTEFTEQEKEEVKHMIEQSQRRYFEGQIKLCDKYKESQCSNFPPVGTRVRRGPDWKYEQQDGYGPGTITGHNEDNTSVFVEWDAGHANIYRYGSNKYDVVPVDDIRILKPDELIAVGCQVKPGKDGEHLGLDQTDTGVVVRLFHGKPKVLVRWTKDGRRGEYSYGADGVYEVELWQYAGRDVCESATETDWFAQLSGTKPRRNKNNPFSVRK